MKNKNKYYLIYQITNILNGMIYIGCHVTTNINDNYMGSGTNITKAFKKYGKTNFYKELLFIFDNEKEMHDKERELVDLKFIKDPNTYNIILGGSTFLTLDTITVKDKNGNTFNVHKTDSRYLSGELVGINKGMITVKDKNSNMFSVDRNDERYLSGELIPISRGNITAKDKDGNRYYISKNDPRFLSGELVGFTKGFKLSEEHKNKIRKTKILNQVPNGTCFIHNDEKTIRVKIEDLNLYLNQGWLKGRKNKNAKKIIQC